MSFRVFIHQTSFNYIEDDFAFKRLYRIFENSGLFSASLRVRYSVPERALGCFSLAGVLFVILGKSLNKKIPSGNSSHSFI